MRGKGTTMALDTLGQDILDVLANHAPDIERALSILQRADSDPLLKAALAMADPVAKSVGADFLARLDAEFSKVAAQNAASAALSPAPAEAPAEPGPAPAPDPVNDPGPDAASVMASDSGDPRLRH